MQTYFAHLIMYLCQRLIDILLPIYLCFQNIVHLPLTNKQRAHATFKIPIFPQIFELSRMYIHVEIRQYKNKVKFENIKSHVLQFHAFTLRHKSKYFNILNIYTDHTDAANVTILNQESRSQNAKCFAMNSETRTYRYLVGNADSTGSFFEQKLARYSAERAQPPHRKSSIFQLSLTRVLLATRHANITLGYSFVRLIVPLKARDHAREPTRRITMESSAKQLYFSRRERLEKTFQRLQLDTSELNSRDLEFRGNTQ